ncbi:MAG: hypothetical protein LBV53_00120 [Mycoplasmataceae bacterium]|jgi:hypothetical protein|nr:hypothetical protein [Mycoplasmataceae bacterium]
MNNKISKKIDMKERVKNLKPMKKLSNKANSVLVSFRVSGHELAILKLLAKEEDTNISIFTKNLLLAYIEKEENERGTK